MAEGCERNGLLGKALTLFTKYTVKDSDKGGDLMDSQEIQHFLITLAIIGTFLMIGTFLRAKVKLFQKLFLPACVIGGLLALLLGPKVFGIIPFPTG